jgi:hypothetical protein
LKVPRRSLSAVFDAVAVVGIAIVLLTLGPTNLAKVALAKGLYLYD